jgi:hypothetical protein
MQGCRAEILLVSLVFVPLGMLVHEDFLLAYLAGLIACKLLR